MTGSGVEPKGVNSPEFVVGKYVGLFSDDAELDVVRGLSDPLRFYEGRLNNCWF